MKTLNIRQLIDLVEGGSSSGESCIQKVFEWQFERNMSVARWALGLATSLLIAFVASYLNAKQVIGPWEFGFGLLSAILAGTYGVYLLVQLRLMSAHFTAAVSLYAKLKNLEEFISKYRRAT